MLRARVEVLVEVLATIPIAPIPVTPPDPFPESLQEEAEADNKHEDHNEGKYSSESEGIHL